jgi:hypothetical protein
MAIIVTQLPMPFQMDQSSLIPILEEVCGGEQTLEQLKILLRSEFSTEETAADKDLVVLRYILDPLSVARFQWEQRMVNGIQLPVPMADLLVIKLN